MEATIFLTYLAVILLCGILSTLVSNRIKIPNILLLIIMGMILSYFFPDDFPAVFLTSISILALVMIVFDSTSRFKLQVFDKLSLRTLWLSLVFLVFNAIFLISICYPLCSPYSPRALTTPTAQGQLQRRQGL